MLRSSGIVGLLERQRLELGLSCAAVAKRARLSLRTVQRVLSGEDGDPGIGTVVAIGEALGVKLRLEAESAEVVRRRAAEEKASRLLSMVQGTAALEVQAVSEETMRVLRERTVNELLAGSPRRLWAD